MTASFPPRRETGVTLIELMIVLTVAAVLIGLAVPNLREFFVTNRLSSASNEWVAALSTARSEAIRRATNVVVVVDEQTSATANWGSGKWKMCADINRNSSCDNSEEVIRRGGPAGNRTTVYANFATGKVIFDAQGRATSVALPATPAGGLFVVCYDSTSFVQSNRSRSRAFQFNPAGRIRLALDSDGNGVPNVEKYDGTVANVAGTCTAPSIP